MSKKQEAIANKTFANFSTSFSPYLRNASKLFQTFIRGFCLHSEEASPLPNNLLWVLIASLGRSRQLFYEMPAPIIKDSPIEITIAMNPTALLSFLISVSTLKPGVKNSKMK